MKKLIKALPASLLMLATSHAFAGDWHLAYSHDEQGNALEGSFEELKKDYLNGASIRLVISDGAWRMNPDMCVIASSKPNVISCQARNHGSSETGLIKNVYSIDKISTEGLRILQMYNTNGNYMGENRLPVSVKWYTDI